MAAGDIIAARIASAAAHNGWVAEIDIDGLAVGGTYAFGLGANNDPSTAKIVFTLTSQGYDNTGAATTIQRTVYGTQWVRKPYPDQATADEGTSGGTLTVRVALSDFVYDPDTSINVSIGSGFYTQGTPTNAVIGMAVTNNSTLAYPKVIGRWAWPSFETVQSDFLLEAVCFHRSALDGKPVACVVFEVSDGSTTQAVTATAMTVSSRSGDVNAVLVYAVTIPISGFTQGAVLTANFIAYPWIGDSGSVLASDSGVTPPDERLCPHKLLCDKNGTYGGAFAVVDATNGQASTAETWVSAVQATAESNYAWDNTKSYSTIGRAVAAIKAYNNTNYSRANPGGGTVLLTATTHDFPGSSNAALGDMDTWVTLTRLSTLTRAQAGVDAGAFTAINAKKVKITGVTLAGNSTVLVWSGNMTDSALWVDDCVISFTGNVPFSQWKAAHATRNSITASSVFFGPSAASRCAFALVRGNDGPTTASGSGIACDQYAVLGNRNCQPVFNNTGNAAGQAISDNSMVAFNTQYGLDAGFIVIALSNPTTLVHGLAIVQNVAERTDGLGPIAEIYDGGIAASTNVLLWHNTLAGQRANVAYNDNGSTPYLHSNWSQRNNLFDDWNNKDDTYGPGNAARTGAWPVGYGIGSRGNHWRETTFGGEFLGLDSVEDGGTWAFVDDASHDNGGGGDASGNGDYHPTPSATAYALVPDGGAVLPFDLEGARRRLTGGGSAGAYEMNPPETTSGLLMLLQLGGL